MRLPGPRAPLVRPELKGGIEKPKTIQEALEKLDEYAKKLNAWVIFKHYVNHAFAYLAYPSP